MVIRYKVVTGDRESVIALSTLVQVPRKRAEARTALSAFVRKYNKGTVVKAHPQSLGILVFEKRMDAELFRSFPWLIRNSLILRVKAIGRGRRVTELLADGGTSLGLGCLDAFLAEYGNLRAALRRGKIAPVPYVYMRAPAGTMAYPVVEVLD